ncbi:hypothetical protein EMIT0P291_80195 [Pseudomonas sp. IT-P291]
MMPHVWICWPRRLRRSANNLQTLQIPCRSEPARSYNYFCASVTDLSIQPHPSKQMDIKVRLSFSVRYPAQAFFKARIYQIYQQT